MYGFSYLFSIYQLIRLQDDGSLIIACERCNIWQHMACLGFSKEDAESNDFHFVCSDCKRKEEDAKRPKISLKLKLGASSSPISDRVEAPDALDQDIQAKKRKSSEILDHGIRTKKRKSSESNGLPPMGRFGVPQPNSKLTKGTPNNGHTYQSVMNPPSFPPQNQTSRPNFNGVSPGSQMYTSPYGNAYHQQASQMTNGYPANFPTSNGVHNGSHHESSNFGRTPQLPMGDSYTGYQANGLNGCSGGHSSLPNAAVAPSHPSDIKSSVKESTSPNPLNMFPSTPSTNLPPAPAAVTSVSGHSPQKPLQSSHSMSFQYSTPSNSFQGSSNSLQGTPSPNMAPPALGNQIFSGLSPSKQTPARPASSHSIGSVPVLPPVEKLAPSPRALSPILPMKGAPVQDMQATDEQKSSTTSDVPAMRASGDVVSHE